MRRWEDPDRKQEATRLGCKLRQSLSLFSSKFASKRFACPDIKKLGVHTSTLVSHEHKLPGTFSCPCLWVRQLPWVVSKEVPGPDYQKEQCPKAQRGSHRKVVCVCVCVCVVCTQSCPTLCDPTRLLCPWDFSSKNTRVGCHFVLQGIFPTQASNSHFLCLLQECRFFTTGAPWEKGTSRSLAELRYLSAAVAFS